MNLNIDKIPESDYKLIPVASQLVPKDLKTITHKETLYEIVDSYQFKKGEFIPKGFLLFVMGKEIDLDLFWRRYPESKYLKIFVCKPTTAEEYVEKLTENNKDVPDIFG